MSASQSSLSRGPMFGVRLCGGPFDGDTGLVQQTLPERLWAWACSDSDCKAGGTHWTFVYDELPDGERGAAYDWDHMPPDRRGFNIYVYGELVEPEDARPDLVEAEMSA